MDNTAERFWRSVKRLVDPAACWEWSGSCIPGGYGQIRAWGKQEKAHRVSWILHFGAIPEGMCVLHSCDNPPCVRPDHLWLGTQAENMRDMREKARSGAQRSGGVVAPRSLTREKVLAICALADRGGWTGRLLGRHFGVSQVLVVQILNGRVWRHVTGRELRPVVKRSAGVAT